MKVSIIIPVYNVEKYLAQCLDSAVNQTLDEIEIIAVNDGSTDGSLSILKEYERRYTNFRVINKQNSGQGSARNIAMKQAKGEYIYFLDSDDYIIHNNIIEYCYSIASDHCLDIITFDSKDMKDDGEKTEEIFYTKCDRKNKLESRIVNGETFFNECFEKDAYKYSSCLSLYRRDFLVKNNLIYPEDRIYEDVPFTIFTFIKAEKLLYVPYQFYWRRVHESSTTSVRVTEKNVYSQLKNGNDVKNFYLKNKETLQENTNNNLIKLVNACYQESLMHCAQINMDENNILTIKMHIYNELNSLNKEVSNLKSWF